MLKKSMLTAIIGTFETLSRAQRMSGADLREGDAFALLLINSLE